MWPLHIAVLMENFPAVKYLIENCKHDVDIKTAVNRGQNEGFTAVHYACHKGNFDILHYLLDLGGNLKATS